MRYRYSIVITPDGCIVNFIKSMKDQLASEMGWYNSKNSKAHITICELYLSERELEIFERSMVGFCGKQFPFTIRLVKTGAYSNGAFFLSPDDDSKQLATILMRQFNANQLFPIDHKSNDPHVSIGRRLSAGHLEVAQKLWGNKCFDLPFLCDGLTIRKLNENRKQFEEHKKFVFTGGNDPQLKLF